MKPEHFLGEERKITYFDDCRRHIFVEMGAGWLNETKPTRCDVIPCNSNMTNLCPTAPPPGCAAETSDDDFLELGCFEKSVEHGPSGSAASVYDWSCMNHTGTSPCRSGLPFYSMRSNALIPALCFEFCVGKGMDIFALVDGVECRCGASAVNTQGDVLNLRHLQFNPAELTLHTDDMTPCPIRAYRYMGHYEAGAVPFGLTQILDTDSEYQRSIYAGKKVSHEDAPDGQKTTSPPPQVVWRNH